jgi:hypothetical protein
MDRTVPTHRKYRQFIVLFLIIAVVGVGYADEKGMLQDASPSRAAFAALPQDWLEHDPAIADLVSRVNETEIHRSAYDLQNISTRNFSSEGNRRAADYLHSRLAAISGLEVTYASGVYRNVIASLPGTGNASGEVVVVGAHYDTFSSDPGRATGATDNAAGVAIVLELARVMSAHEFDRTVRFAFWNAEEQGLAGSRAYVEEARAQSMEIPLYLNFDSSAFDPDRRLRLDIMYDDATEPVAALFARSNALYGIGFNLTYNKHRCDSDHDSFREGGYPAITTHTEEHGDSAHTPGDTIDLVSTEYARMNGQLGLSVLAREAGLRS